MALDGLAARLSALGITLPETPTPLSGKGAGSEVVSLLSSFDF